MGRVGAALLVLSSLVGSAAADSVVPPEPAVQPLPAWPGTTDEAVVTSWRG